MDSGQHDTAPTSRRPRAFARRDRLQVLEHRLGIGAVVEQRGDHHGSLRKGGELLQKGDLGVPALGEHEDAPSGFAEGCRPRPASPRSSARREGIGSPPSPLCAGDVLVEKPIAPARSASASSAFIARTSAVGRGAPGGVRAHHVGAQRRVPGEDGDVQRAPLPLEHVEILGDGLEVPADALAQHVERHAFHLREVAHHELAVAAAAGRDGEAAVADHRGGDAERGRGRDAADPR